MTSCLMLLKREGGEKTELQKQPSSLKFFFSFPTDLPVIPPREESVKDKSGGIGQDAASAK